MAKYCWGNGVFPLPIWGVTMIFGALLGTVVFVQTTPTGPAVSDENGVNIKTVGGVIMVTMGWILHYYNCIGHQVGLKFTNNFVPHPQAGTVGERCMMNTLEQGIPFVSLLWMHALFVDVATAVSFGWLYVITRLLYPIFYCFYGHFTVLCELSTMPNYQALAFFACAITDAWYTGDPLSLINRLDGQNPVVVFLLFFLQFPILCMAVLWVLPTGGLMTVLNNKANPKGGLTYAETAEETDEEEE